jgi:Kdo2-lipid IVA lauroyltransferase/acyltransferase
MGAGKNKQRGFMKISQEHQDRIIAAVSAALFQVARWTPSSMGLMGGRLLGAAACRLLNRHRNIAVANLKFAFQNEKSPAAIQRLVYQNFQQWGMIAFEWAQCALVDRMAPGKLPLRVRVKGHAHIQAARRKGSAVLLLSAHFGNWEYGHYYYARYINTLNFIVRRIDNPYLESRRVASYQHHGVNVLYKEVGLKAAIKNLRKGQDLVIFADQKANPREGVTGSFFGRNSTSIPLVASFAKKFQLPIVPMFVVRRGNSATHELTFLPELEYSPSESVTAITQRQNDIIEKIIRRHPDHWLWMHRRWKTEYPEIYQTN